MYSQNYNKDYYKNGVISLFRRKLQDKDIDQDDVLFVLHAKHFPFKFVSKIKNGKETGCYMYDKNLIDSYFKDIDSIDEIRRLINKYRHIGNSALASYIETRHNYKPESYDKTYDEIRQESKEANREKMQKYLDSITATDPESDMESVSKKLLIDDDVMYESENLSDVETEWKPKEGIFLSKSPRSIANYLLKNSKDKGQAMKRLTFYMNRAGKNLTNKTVLNKVKDLLKESEDFDNSKCLSFINEWNYTDGLYIKERKFNYNSYINEDYSDLKKIEKYEKIPSEDYLEKYPNLKLSRMLGNEYLIGDNWKKFPYRRSYYFEIKMRINTSKFKYYDIVGLLRISDHKVNPYRFAQDFGMPYKVNGKNLGNGKPLTIKDENGKIKKYAFGISITLPFTQDLIASKRDIKYEPHVFEYITQDFSDENIDSLKNMLDKIVHKLETATIGIKDKFSPYEYKEVTINNIDTIFNINDDDRYIYGLNKIKTEREKTSDNQTIRIKGIKKLNEPKKDLYYYVSSRHMEPIVITVNPRKKQANQTVVYNEKIYRARNIQDLLRPYNHKTGIAVGFPDGLYVWKNETGNVLAAAIVEDRKLKKIDV